MRMRISSSCVWPNSRACSAARGGTTLDLRYRTWCRSGLSPSGVQRRSFRSGSFARSSLWRSSFGGVGQLESELPRAIRFVVSLVRLDDALHQAVPDHVAFIEMDKADALDAS